MSRLIDADKLKAFYKHWDSEYSGEELKKYKRVFDNIVDRQETVDETVDVDAVKIVRCKDCKHAVPETYYKSWDYKCILFQHAMMADDYCSHGKRKEKE